MTASVPVTLVAMAADNFFVDVPLISERFEVDWINLTPFTFALMAVFSISRVTEVSRKVRVLSDLPRAPFLDRIKPEIGRELLYLSSQDHYIEVVTTKGRDLILGRFSEAVAQLAGWDGNRIHRSHWVARRAVKAERRRSGKRWLVLLDGKQLPVSRTYSSTVDQFSGP